MSTNANRFVYRPKAHSLHFVVLGVGIGSRVDWRGFCATNHVSASHYRHGSSGFKPKEIAQLTTPLK